MRLKKIRLAAWVGFFALTLPLIGQAEDKIRETQQPLWADCAIFTDLITDVQTDCDGNIIGTNHWNLYIDSIASYMDPFSAYDIEVYLLESRQYATSYQLLGSYFVRGVSYQEVNHSVRINYSGDYRALMNVYNAWGQLICSARSQTFRLQK
jgi:hypothetical protein